MGWVLLISIWLQGGCVPAPSDQDSEGGSGGVVAEFGGGAPAASGLTSEEAGDPPGALASRQASPGALCRCIPLPLAEYYTAADEVLLGRMVGSEPRGADHLIEIVPVERAWKMAAGRNGVTWVGESVQYLTSTSSAACGIVPVVGAHFLLFAAAPNEFDLFPRVDSCAGSRLFRTEDDPEPQGFVDVPGRFVVSQLDALSGLEFLVQVVADWPDPENPANASLVGLLDLPAFSHGGSVAVREAPSPEARLLARIESYAQLESREASYEVGAAVVTARVDGWSQVRLLVGTPGWIAPEDGGSWFPYAELPIARLTYLTGGWSGHIWPEPGAGLPARSSRKGASDREEYPVEVHEAVELAGTTWFRIDLLSADPCMGGEVRTELSGWVPAHGIAGEPLVWFYSRGC